MRHRVGTLLGVIVLLGIMVVWRAWPGPLPQATASVTPLRHRAPAEPDVQMADMHLMAQLGDQTVLQVVAKYAVSSGVQQQAIVHDLQAEMQQAAGRAWQVSAARGLVDRVTGDITAQGGGRIHGQRRKQTSPQAIDALLPQSCEGQKASLEVTAERMTFDQNTRTFVFENQVRIRHCDMTIGCDRLQVVGHDQSETTEHIVATGNVRIEYGTRRVTAQRAEYFVQQQRIVLTGNPRAWDTHDRHEMTGQEIVVELPQDHVEVKQARVRFHPRRPLPKGP